MVNGTTATTPCRSACPAGVDIPRYIKFIKEGKFSEALAVIRESIPFPGVCGYACVHPCESKCARAQYDDPVAIRLLKRAALEYGCEITEEAQIFPTGKRVAIIGAGPCGLTAAYFLAGQGHRVDVYEALPEPGGMLRYGIPEYRLPNHVIGRDINAIIKRGVNIITNTIISSPEELVAKGYDAVLVTVGAWKSQTTGIEGEDAAHVMSGISFLKDANAGNPPVLGKKVVVVGGGNTAVDAARASVRLGAGVTLLYRRTLAQMPANPEEIKDAVEEGVKIKFLTAPVKIEEGKITCLKMTLGVAEDSGRPKPEPVPGSEFAIDCDTVIMAVGQTVDSGAMMLETDHLGSIKVDQDFTAGKKAVFAAGDAVTGPSSIIGAIAQGRMASVCIDRYLGGSGIIDRREEHSYRPEVPEEEPRGTFREKVSCVPVPERLNSFNLVELGYDRVMSMKEARRCLACDARKFEVMVNENICKGCSYCKEVCSLGIFEITDGFNSQGYNPAGVMHADRCIGCLRCLYTCPDFAISVVDLSS